MSEVRNIKGNLVCLIDDATGTIEIKIKGYTTIIKRNSDGTTEITNR